ncbi:MAG: hypothetical protein IT534_01390 [Bauldia sp.]|nr:hypothetical protein [Bauldia sp.]
MFGRLKLALVALILMPAAAFAAGDAPRHAPGASANPAAVETKIAIAKPASAAVVHRHRSPLTVTPALPTTIALFVAGLGHDAVPVAAAGKASPVTAFAVGRPGLHHPA